MASLSFMKIVSSKCSPIDSLITNFQKYIENEVNNECNYINESTLHYIEYDIPTAYIAKYGRSACLNVLENYLKSPEINRCNYSDPSYYLYKHEKSQFAIKENMYAKYVYKKESDSTNGDKFLCSDNCYADGILLPVVIKKDTVSEKVDETLSYLVSDTVSKKAVEGKE